MGGSRFSLACTRALMLRVAKLHPSNPLFSLTLFPCIFPRPAITTLPRQRSRSVGDPSQDPTVMIFALASGLDETKASAQRIYLIRQAPNEPREPKQVHVEVAEEDKRPPGVPKYIQGMCSSCFRRTSQRQVGAGTTWASLVYPSMRCRSFSHSIQPPPCLPTGSSQRD